MNSRLLNVGLIACLLLCAGGSVGAARAAGDPVLFFCDISSGPRTGNTDISHGQTSGQHGAIVTIWGRNLGTPGTFSVTCNGAPAAYVYVHQNATGGADLYTIHRMQMISFQISNTAQNGPGSISVVVNGKQSNALPFTVRTGSIYFVKTTGNDATGDGSWANSWRSIIKAKETIIPGDIVYVCDGVNQSGEDAYGACVNLGTNGEPGKPLALVVYPGATSIVGNDSLYYAFRSFYADTGGTSRHWVISQFTIRTGGLGVEAVTGYRVVGNYLTAPNGDGNDASITIEGDSVFVAGNELRDVGKTDCDKLYHGIYGKGYRTDSGPRAPIESEREIAWNYIHDCRCDRAIDVYSEGASSAFIQGHRIHDNVIMDQHGDGILLGYFVVGENWIYNNLIVRAGLGPEWGGGEASSHAGIRIDCGHESWPATTIYCYNNTLVGCGWSGAIWHEESGHLLVSPMSLSMRTTLHFRNNIVLSTGEPYVASGSGSLASGSNTNCWYGDGSAPAWDVSALSVHPMFVDTLNSNFRLAAGSPCINAGQDLSTVVQRDLFGTVRPQGGAFDMGAYEFETVTGIGSIEKNLPGFLLNPCYPNPFNPATTVSYTLPKLLRVHLSIVDVAGRMVRTLVDEEQMGGTYTVPWDGTNGQGLPASSGTYFCCIRAGDCQATEKILLIH